MASGSRAPRVSPLRRSCSRSARSSSWTTTFWIAAALALYVIVLVIAFAVITPNFQRSLRALEADGAESATYKAAMARGRTFGIVVSVLVLAIVFLMVVKPTLAV